MYIPSLLFGQANTCISGSGFQETGEFISGSQVWKYFKFTSQGSGSFVIDSGSTTNARVFLVGGGGGGGNTKFNGEALNETAGGGGGAQSNRYSPGGYLKAVRGGGRNPQGNDGGDADGNLCSGIAEATATGGGGAGGASDDTDCVSSSGYQTPGGNALTVNVDGTNTKYACGGASMRKGTWEAATGDTQVQASRMYGAGGWGNSDSYSSTKKSGRPGIMVILVPVCRTDLFDCTTYDFDGGGTGGDITYIECGTSTLTTTSIEFQQTGSFCTYEIPGEYPTSTGTVSLNSTGSCNQDFPIPILPTCTPGQVTGSAFIYDIQVPTACYPTPASCQQIREASSIVTYTTYDGNAVTESIGGGIGNGQFQVCAREYPAPTLSCGTIGGNSTPCSITKSSNICGYFCTSSV